MLGIFNKIKNALKKTIEDQDNTVGDAGEKVLISDSLDKNIDYIKSVFDRCSDVVVREFKIPAKEAIDASLIYIDGMVDDDLVAESILRSLQLNPAIINDDKVNKSNAFTMVKERLLSIGEIKTVRDMDSLVEHVLSGQAALLIDGSAQAIISSVRKLESNITMLNRQINDIESKKEELLIITKPE